MWESEAPRKLDFIRPQKRFSLAVTRHALRGGAALRVAHLTDLHLEDGANAAGLKRLVRIVNAQHPDLPSRATTTFWAQQGRRRS